MNARIINIAAGGLGIMVILTWLWVLQVLG